jgi:hypothetical protein
MSIKSKKGVPKRRKPPVRVWVGSPQFVDLLHESFGVKQEGCFEYILAGSERKRVIREILKFMEDSRGEKYSFQIVDELKAKLKEMKGG